MKTQIWQDGWFLSLPPEERLAFFYTFSNTNVRPSGIYQLAPQVWALSVGVTVESIHDMIKKFEAAGKIRYDQNYSVVWVVNYLRHNPNRANLKTIEGVKSDLEDFGKCSFLKEFLEAYPSYTIGSIEPVLREGKERGGKVYSLVPSLHKTPIDEFFVRYQTRLNQRPVIQGGRDGKLLGDIEKQLGREEFCRRLDLFFASTDEFIIKAGFTVGVFVSQVNKLGVSLGRNLSATEKVLAAGRRLMERNAIR